MRIARKLHEAEPGMDVVGEAVDGAEAIELCHRSRVGVVMMDIRMPRVDGIETIRRIGADERLFGVRVLVIHHV